MSVTHRPIQLLLTALLAIATSFPATAQAIRSTDDIFLGMSTSLSGPAADLGINMRAGVMAALTEVNLAGGIHGRQLQLLSLDDSYEPAKAVPNMRSLVANPRVMAVVGNVGTPTAVVAVPIAN